MKKLKQLLFSGTLLPLAVFAENLLTGEDEKTVNSQTGDAAFPAAVSIIIPSRSFFFANAI